MTTQHSKYHEACQQAEAELPALMPGLDAERRNGECGWHWFYAYKLMELHDWCLANQPRTILELGSGWTTFILARYAAEFRAQLTTVEESEEYQRETQRHLNQYTPTNWHMSPSVMDGNSVRYAALPDVKELDLLYVDGPASEWKGKPVASGDAVKLIEAGCLVKNIVVDIRHQTVDQIRERVGHLYGFEPGGLYPFAKPWYLRPMRHHSWFWRK